MIRKHMMTRTETETENKCRHRNCKCGEDRAQPNFIMIQSAHKMNQKQKHSVKRELRREAAITNSNSSCASNVRDDVNPSVVQWFHN